MKYMKKILILLGILSGSVGLVCGFTSHALSPNPPKRSMVEAYSMALQALDTATNKFYCVASNIDRDCCPVGAWVFHLRRKYDESQGCLWAKQVLLRGAQAAED